MCSKRQVGGERGDQLVGERLDPALPQGAHGNRQTHRMFEVVVSADLAGGRRLLSHQLADFGLEIGDQRLRDGARETTM
jgi:hypothetical protein